MWVFVDRKEDKGRKRAEPGTQNGFQATFGEQKWEVAKNLAG